MKAFTSKSTLYLLLFFTVILNPSGIESQSHRFQVKDINGNMDLSTVYLGEIIKFKILNDTSSNNPYSFTDNKYSIGIAGQDLTLTSKYSFDGLTVSSLQLPCDTNIIGNNERLTIYDSSGKPIGYVVMSIEGKSPKINFDGHGILYANCPYCPLTLKGKSLASIVDIRVPDNTLSVEDFNVDDNNNLTLHVKANIPADPSAQHKFEIIYKTQKGNTKIFSDIKIPVFVKYPEEFTIIPSKLFRDDLEDGRKIPIKISMIRAAIPPNAQASISGDDENIICDKGVILSFVNQNTTNTNVQFRPSTEPGMKEFSIIDRNRNNQTYKGNILVLATPKVNTVRGGIRNALKFCPYDISNNTIVLEGINLNEVKLAFWDDRINEKITIEEDPKSSDKRKIARLIFNDQDKNNFEFGKYQLALIRQNYQNQYVTYTDFNNEIEIVEPKRICDITKVFDFNIKDEKTAKYVSPAEDQSIPVEEGSRISLRLRSDNINDEDGIQAVSIRASLYDEDGNFIESKEYNNTRLKKSYALLSTKARTYETAKQIEYWNLSNEFKDKLLPWRKLKIEIQNSNDYYKGTDLIPDYSSQELFIEGSFWSNFYSTITMPPLLIAYGFKAKQVQLLPLNFGYGVKFEPRNEDGEKSWLSAGLFIAGLNILKVTGKDAAASESEEFIGQNALSGLVLGEISLLNKEKKIKLPIQFGAGAVFNGRSTKSPQIIGILGLGLNYNF